MPAGAVVGGSGERCRREQMGMCVWGGGGGANGHGQRQSQNEKWARTRTDSERVGERARTCVSRAPGSGHTWRIQICIALVLILPQAHDWPAHRHRRGPGAGHKGLVLSVLQETMRVWAKSILRSSQVGLPPARRVVLQEVVEQKAYPTMGALHRVQAEASANRPKTSGGANTSNGTHIHQNISKNGTNK